MSRRRRPPFPGADRMAVFVPAVMSVGLLFWLLSELRDVARSQRERSRAKRSAIAGLTVAARTAGCPARPDRRPSGTNRYRIVPEAVPPVAAALHPRAVYGLGGVVLVTGAVYVTIGSVANYRRHGGYVSDVAWLLALSLVVAALAALVGVGALITYARHPDPPRWFRPLLWRSPLSVEPGVDRSGRPAWSATAAVVATWAAFALLTMLVSLAPDEIVRFDEWLAGIVRGHPLPGPAIWLDVAGDARTVVVLLLATLLAARRCRVLLVAVVAAVAASQFVGAVVRAVAARPRPAGTWVTLTDSYPSGQTMLLALASGLLPAAVVLATRRPWAAWPLRIGLGVVTAAVGYDVVAEGRHWPLDVVGGILLGAAVVASADWAVAVRRLHLRCGAGCPRHPDGVPAPPRRVRGAIPLRPSAEAVVRTAAHVTAGVAAIGLAVLTLTVGLPTNPESSGLGAALQRPAQLALAGLVSVAALVGWRWPAVAAVLLAVAASGLGIFAGVEYQPTTAIALTLALFVPAVLMWLTWQHRRRPAEIVLVAVVTAALVTGTWVGAATVYDGYFGPTHPDSTAVALDTDRVEWVWTGALTSRSVTVTARLAAGHERAAIVLAPDDDDEADGTGTGNGPAGARSGGVVRSATIAAGPERIVKMPVDGLEPDTRYRFAVEVDGTADTTRGTGTLRTPGEGAFSFRFAVASCARTGSNGAVFDAIAEADPLLYLQTGDLHYENLEATVPGPFLDAFGFVLTRPAQAALARRVPMDYVWDDHDYGANNADATSPTRDAVRSAYRTAVPHHELPSSQGAIFHAFTIGRVRFIATDGRSERTAETFLSEEQERWLVDELTTAARTHALVVWINATPWIGAASPTADTWAGWADQRGRIADAIAAGGVDNLVMVAGDAHMVAIDDGTNSGYATGGGGGFPVLQAAALDRPGSVKGGPYSEGTYPGGGQFGLVDVTDRGDAVDVRLTGLRWDGSTIVTLERSFPVG